MSVNYSQHTKSLVEFPLYADALTYEPFFGLNEKPFSLNVDGRFVHDSPTFAATKEGLLAGIRRREGLLVLTGEIGTGKTTLCRAVLRDLGRKTYSSMVPDPFASREDLLKMLLIDFGALPIQELTEDRLRQASRTELGYLVAEFLDALAPDAFAVVIIDEAQNLSLPLIEETRILSDTFGAAGRLQIVFVGQPELHAKLKSPEMRQVDQRVCGYHRLAPMSREAVGGYIQHRLHVAGDRGDRVLFSPEIVDQLHQRSGGVARLINRVCDRALHLAYERKADGVDREVLETALLEIGSATLSPTWDSIIFAESPSPLPAPTPVAAPTAQAAPTALPLGEAESFQKEIDHWVSQDLAPPARRLTSLQMFLDEAPVKPRRSPSRRETSTPTVTTERTRHPRPQTYIGRALRRWAKRAAIAVAVLVAVTMAFVGVSLLLETQEPLSLPRLPEAPAKAVSGLALITTPLTEAPPIAATRTETPQAIAAPGDFLVAVGLFASRERADQLVDALTQAGLPAMQRPQQLRTQEVQQIVLGPYFNRADAVADLGRLKAMGGYNDASVIAQ